MLHPLANSFLLNNCHIIPRLARCFGAGPKAIIELLGSLIPTAEEDETQLPQEGCDLLYHHLANFVDDKPGDDQDVELLCSAANLAFILRFQSNNGTVVNKLEIERWIGWVEHVEFPRDVRVRGVLCLGNTAQSDQSSIELARLGIAERLKRFIVDSNEELVVQHAVLGTLKNLSIPAPNKISLSNLIPVAAKILLEGNMSLKPSAATFLKNLANQNSDNCKDIVKYAREFLERPAQSPHEATKFETLRMLCNISRYGSTETRMQLIANTPKFIGALFDEMLCAPHPILRMDALLTLIIFAQTAGKSVKQQLPSSWSSILVDVLNEALKSGRLEIVANSLTLISTLGGFPLDRWQLVKPAIFEYLLQRTASNSAEEKSVIADIRNGCEVVDRLVVAFDE